MKQYKISFLLSVLFFASLSFCVGTEDSPLTLWTKGGRDIEKYWFAQQLSERYGGKDFLDKKIGTLLIALTLRERLRGAIIHSLKESVSFALKHEQLVIPAVYTDGREWGGNASHYSREKYRPLQGKQVVSANANDLDSEFFMSLDVD